MNNEVISLSKTDRKLPRLFSVYDTIHAKDLGYGGLNTGYINVSWYVIQRESSVPSEVLFTDHDTMKEHPSEYVYMEMRAHELFTASEVNRLGAWLVDSGRGQRLKIYEKSFPTDYDHYSFGSGNNIPVDKLNERCDFCLPGAPTLKVCARLWIDTLENPPDGTAWISDECASDQDEEPAEAVTWQPGWEQRSQPMPQEIEYAANCGCFEKVLPSTELAQPCLPMELSCPLPAVSNNCQLIQMADNYAYTQKHPSILKHPWVRRRKMLKILQRVQQGKAFSICGQEK